MAELWLAVKSLPWVCEQDNCLTLADDPETLVGVGPVVHHARVGMPGRCEFPRQYARLGEYRNIEGFERPGLQARRAAEHRAGAVAPTGLCDHVTAARGSARALDRPESRGFAIGR